MKHFNRAVEKLTEDFVNVEDPKILKRLAIAFSNRIDLLEKYISENTDVDGTEVGFSLKPKKDKL
jgi:hypothetical protein